MRKLAMLLSLALGLPALAEGTLWLRYQANEAARWRVIAAQVPPTPLKPSNTNLSPNDSWLVGLSTGKYQVGHVACSDGQVCRFAFASHHLFTGPDSYTVFKGDQGTIRVKGGGFCCEVEFDNQKQPADTQALVVLLRRRGDDVAILK